MSKPFLKIIDLTSAFMDCVDALKVKETMVGIPEDENGREDGEINNASLLFINNFGSPAQNIPARPVMAIGIRKAQDAIVLEMEKAAKAAFTKGPAILDKYYERVGIIASSSVKRVINSQEGILEPSQATLDSRKRRGFNGNKALIETGQMRNAITYVVRNK